MPQDPQQSQKSPTDPRKALYEGVSEHLDIGTFEEFNSKMDNPDSRKKFFDGVSQHVDLGEFKTFETKIGKPIAAAPAPDETVPFTFNKEAAQSYLTKLRDPKFVNSHLNQLKAAGKDDYTEYQKIRDKRDLVEKMLKGEFGKYQPPGGIENVVQGFLKGAKDLGYMVNPQLGILLSNTIGYDPQQDKVGRLMQYAEEDPDLKGILESVPTREAGMAESIAKGVVGIIPAIPSFITAGKIVADAAPVIASIPKVIPRAGGGAQILVGKAAARALAHNIVTAPIRGAAVFGAQSVLTNNESVQAPLQGVGFETAQSVTNAIEESLPGKYKALKYFTPVLRAVMGGTTFAGGASLGAALTGEEQPNIFEEFGKGFALSFVHSTADKIINRMGEKNAPLTSDEKIILENAKRLRAARTPEEAEVIIEPSNLPVLPKGGIPGVEEPPIRPESKGNVDTNVGGRTPTPPPSDISVVKPSGKEQVLQPELTEQGDQPVGSVNIPPSPQIANLEEISPEAAQAGKEWVPTPGDEFTITDREGKPLTMKILREGEGELKGSYKVSFDGVEQKTLYPAGMLRTWKEKHPFTLPSQEIERKPSPPPKPEPTGEKKEIDKGKQLDKALDDIKRYMRNNPSATPSNDETLAEMMKAKDAISAQMFESKPMFNEPTLPNSPDRKFLGVNSEGKNIYEDKNGVRFKLESNNRIRVSEPVSVIPPTGEYGLSANRPDEFTLEGEKAPQIASPSKPSSVSPIESTVKIGDYADVMGDGTVVSNVKVIGGIQYELFNGTKLSDNRGWIRATDLESGNVITVKRHPTYDNAEAEFNKTVEAAQRGAEPPLTSPTNEPTLPSTTESTDEPVRENQPVVPAGESPLAETPAEPIQATPSKRPTRSGSGKRSPSDKASTPEPGGQVSPGKQPDPIAGELSGVGDGEGTVSVSSGRNYRISDTDRIGTGGAVERYDNNVAALKLLKQLEEQDRDATPEEQSILVKYVGWGDTRLQPLFEYYYSGSSYSVSLSPTEQRWKTRQEELKSILTDDEFDAAKSSVNNAHYTSVPVIQAMWEGLRHLGFKGGRFNEPAIGLGHFVGLIPADLARTTRFTGIDIDPLSARLSKKLYPDVDIRNKGFEEVQFPEGWFDVHMTNVPFGDYGVTDANPMMRGLTARIHNYYFGKMTLLTHPGGLIVAITSRYTMDSSKNNFVRQWLNDKNDFVGAIRLPNNAFSENAGTKVVTDIIVLRKKGAGEAFKVEPWTKEVTKEESKKGEEIKYRVNEYFVAHPEMILGNPGLTEHGGLYGKFEYTVAPNDKDLPTQIVEAFKRMPANIFVPSGRKASTVTRTQAEMIPAPAEVKQGGFVVKGGTLFRRQGDNLVEHKSIGKDVAIQISHLLSVRDAVRSTLRAQLENDDKAVETTRQALNHVYDGYVKKYGKIWDAEGKRQRFILADDPEYPRLLALEVFNKEKNTFDKAPIFTKRVIEYNPRPDKADNAKDALNISLRETNGVDWQRMEELTGKSTEVLREELAGSIYQTPNGDWVTADEYLSGNVKQKLKEAQAAADLDKKYESNVKALTEVIPTDLKASEVEARLGSNWIPTSDIEQFIRELTNARPSVRYIPTTASWIVDYDKSQVTVSAQKDWGIERYHALDLLDDALNGRVPSVYDTLRDGTKVLNKTATEAAREKLGILKEKFRDWVYKDVDRAVRLVQYYNDNFNTHIARKYDGSHLTLPGMTREWFDKLREVQKNGIWRQLQLNNTLLAWTMGAGKTVGMIGAAMEMRRLGLRKKPTFIVPNHMLAQWHSDILSAYPSANILMVTSDDFEKSKRKLFANKIASGDWDAVLMTHGHFGRVSMTPEAYQEFIGEQIAEIDAALAEAQAASGKKNKRDKTVKQLEAAKKRLAEKLKKQMAIGKKEDSVYFEELGIDQLFVDEAHNFKNLYFTTKMTRIAGLGGTEADRSMDMFLKTQYVTEQNNYKGGVVFATGTAVSNSLAELFTMQRYLQMLELKAANIDKFDNWAQTFGEVISVLELATEGSGYRVRSRFAKIVNLPELLTRFWQVADVYTAEMLNLPVPKVKGGKAEIVLAPASQQLKDFLLQLAKRADDIRSGKVDPKDDNMLKISSEGRKAALDFRLIDPRAPDLPTSKVNQAVDRIFGLWERTKEQKSAQVVFINNSTPGGTGFNVYDDIKKKLIARGVPKNEIAFIHDTDGARDKDVAKAQLFENVRTGNVRILMGSIKKLGEGTNIQTKLKGLTLLDPPWKPAEMEQAVARILRPGNENEEVELYRFATENSFDSYMYQTLETKARSIGPTMSGKLNSRTAEDIEERALTYAEVKALASGNPAVLEKTKIDMDLQRLERLRGAWQDSQWDTKRRISYLTSFIPERKKTLKLAEEDLAYFSKDAGKDFSVVINGKTFTERKDAGEQILKVYGELEKQLKPADKKGKFETETLRENVGTFKGTKLSVVVSRTVWSTVEGKVGVVGALERYDGNISESPLGTIISLENAVKPEVMQSQVKYYQSSIDESNQELTDLQARDNQPFEHQGKMDALLKRQSELSKELALDQSEKTAGGNEDDSEEGDTETPSGTLAMTLPGLPQVLEAGKKLSKALIYGTSESPIEGVRFAPSEIRVALERSFSRGKTLARLFAIPYWVGEKYPGFGNRIENGKVVKEGIWGIIDRIAVREYAEGVARIEEDLLNEWKDAHKLSAEQRTNLLDAFKDLNEENPKDEEMADGFFRSRYHFDDDGVRVYNQIRSALHAALQWRMNLDRFKLMRMGPPSRSTFKKSLNKKTLKKYGMPDDEITPILEVLNKPASQIETAQIRALWDLPLIKQIVADRVIERKYNKKTIANYFPMTRPKDHKYAVVARNPDDPSLMEDEYELMDTEMGDEGTEGLPPYFATFGTAAEANKHANELKRQGYSPAEGQNDIVVYRTDSQQFVESFRKGLSEDQLWGLAEDAGIDSDSPVIRQIVEELRSRGFDMHFLERQRAPGFQWTWENVEKNVVEYIDGSVRKYSKYVATRLAEDRLKELKKTKEIPHDIQMYAQEYLDSWQNSSPVEWAALRQGIYMTTLGLSFSNFVQNLTQPLVTTWNQISMELEKAGVTMGFPLTEKIMFDAYRRATAYQLSHALIKVPGNVSGVPASWEAPLERARRQGVISPLQLEQLGGLERDPRQKYPTGGPVRRGAKKFWRAVADVVSIGQRVSEVTNRIHAFMVGLQIGEQYFKLSGDRLYEYAVTMVQPTQFQFGQHNIPQFAQQLSGSRFAGVLRRLAKLALILRGFILNMFSRSAGVVRSKNVGANIRYWGVLLSLAGYRGLPLFGLLIALYNLYLWMTGDEETAEIKERRFVKGIEESMGLPDRTLTTGPVGAATGIETSRILGMGDFPSSRLDERDLLGVGVSIVQSARYGGKALAEGDVARAAQQFPIVPRGVKAYLRGREAEKQGEADTAAAAKVIAEIVDFNMKHGLDNQISLPGFYTEAITRLAEVNRNKKTVIKKMELDELYQFPGGSKLTDADILKLKMGFTPTRLATQYEESKAQRTVGKLAAEKRSALMNRWLQAMGAGSY